MKRTSTLLVLLALAPALFAQDLKLMVEGNIISDVCHFSLDNTTVVLPIISKDELNAQTITVDEPGAGEPLTLVLSDCGGSTAAVKNVRVSVQPADGTPAVGRVFANQSPDATKAQGVGIAVFYENKNVLQQDGSSEVLINDENDLLGQPFTFTTRFQKIGTVTSGQVNTTVVVQVNYQ